MRLFFDIETIPGPVAPNRSEIPLGRLKNKESIENFLNNPNTIQDHWAREALNSMKGRIVSIAWAVDDEMVNVATGEEIDIFDTFLQSIKRPDRPVQYTWIGHNSNDFDLPFIFHRSVALNHELRFQLPSKDNRMDTMKMWAMYRYKQYYSLKGIAEFLGIDVNDDFDGSQVWDLYKSGSIDAIAEHNTSDVNITRQIFKRINF